MKRKKRYLMLGILLFSASLFLLCESTIAAEKKYVMKGEMKAITQQSNTVVIEVPLGQQMFTVGGPLSSDAVLKKGGQPAKLADFSVGEVVTVKWKTTEKGHVIDGMQRLLETPEQLFKRVARAFANKPSLKMNIHDR